MNKETIYPIYLRINSEDVQIGSAKVEFKDKEITGRDREIWDVVLKDCKIQFKNGDFITKIETKWTAKYN